MRKILLLIILIPPLYFTGCDNYLEKEPDMANVEKVNGVFVFIRSEPVSGYENLGILNNDLLNQITEGTVNRHLDDILKNLYNTTKNNVDFNLLLESMITKAKEAYPNCNAVIFRENLSKCEVIKI